MQITVQGVPDALKPPHGPAAQGYTAPVTRTLFSYGAYAADAL